MKDVYWYEMAFNNFGGKHVVDKGLVTEEYKYYGYAGSALKQFRMAAEYDVKLFPSSAIAKQQVEIEILQPKRKLIEIDQEELFICEHCMSKLDITKLFQGYYDGQAELNPELPRPLDITNCIDYERIFEESTSHDFLL